LEIKKDSRAVAAGILFDLIRIIVLADFFATLGKNDVGASENVKKTNNAFKAYLCFCGGNNYRP